MKVLFVCSSGGHLAQLHDLEPWWQHHERGWVTFDSVDATSLLVGERVIWAHHPTTRNLMNALRNLRLAFRLLRRDRPDVVISDGAGVAVPFFLVAKALRIATVYVEVYDRIDSRDDDRTTVCPHDGRVLRPMGRAARAIPRLHVDRPPAVTPAAGPPMVLVVVGTDHHPFDRLVGWAEGWARDHPDIRVVVQFGTSRPPVVAEGFDVLPVEGLKDLFAAATVVVCHGGPGTIMGARSAGLVPLVGCPSQRPRRTRG